MKVSPLKKQIEMMKIDFPFIKVNSDYEFLVRFPDYPLVHYKIELKHDYPKSKPLITRDGESIKIPIITFWLQTCTLSNVIQNLYLISMSNSNEPLIPPPSLSPPVQKTVPPLISPFDGTNKKGQSKSLLISNPLYESFNEKLDETECSEFSEISLENPDENVIKKTGNLYVDTVNMLKLKFRKKEINFNQFMTEFQKLQFLKDKQNV